MYSFYSLKTIITDNLSVQTLYDSMHYYYKVFTNIALVQIPKSIVSNSLHRIIFVLIFNHTRSWHYHSHSWSQTVADDDHGKKKWMKMIIIFH